MMAFIALGVAGFYVYATHDRIEQIELPEVSEAAETGWQDVAEALSAPVGDRADVIIHGNAATECLIDRMTVLGDSTLDERFPRTAVAR